MLVGDRILLTVPWLQKDLARSIQGRQWLKERKKWSFPVEQFRHLLEAFPQMRDEINLDAATYYDQPDKGVSMEKVAELDLRDPEFDIDKEIQGVEIPRGVDLSVTLGDGSKSPLFEHQIKILKLCLKYWQFAVLCEMGTGKTIALIMVIKCLRALGVQVRALIVCPKSVRHSWTSDLDKCGVSGYNIVNGSKNQRLSLLAGSAERGEIAIINYDSLLPTGEDGPWGMFNLVILDESSRIKNPSAKRTKFCLRAFKAAQYRYILSGTPITQNPADIYCQYHFLDRAFLGFNSFYSFRNTYLVMGGFQGYQVIGVRNQEELRKKIGRHSIQLKKEECLDLPEKVFTTRWLDMPKELKLQYEQMKKDCIVELNGEVKLTANIILTKVMRLQQITSGALLKYKDNAKLQALREIIEDLVRDSGKQLVIWCRFKKSIALIQALVEEMGITYGILDGDTKNRDEVIDDFQSGKTKIFIGQVQAGGLGINLWAASTTVYYERPFSLEENKQSEDRIHRIGQRNTCTYIDLCYKGTVDTDVLGAIQKKQDMATFLVDSFLKGDYELRQRYEKT